MAEIQIGFLPLHAVLTGSISTLQTELHLSLERSKSSFENLLEDLLNSLVLKDPRIAVLRKRPESRHQIDLGGHGPVRAAAAATLNATNDALHNAYAVPLDH